MDEQLKLAEEYYLVAAELKTDAQRMIETSFMLSEMADRICEASMRKKKPSMADCVKLDANGNPVSSPSSAGEAHAKD